MPKNELTGSLDKTVENQSSNEINQNNIQDFIKTIEKAKEAVVKVINNQHTFSDNLRKNFDENNQYIQQQKDRDYLKAQTNLYNELLSQNSDKDYGFKIFVENKLTSFNEILVDNSESEKQPNIYKKQLIDELDKNLGKLFPDIHKLDQLTKVVENIQNEVSKKIANEKIANDVSNIMSKIGSSNEALFDRTVKAKLELHAHKVADLKEGKIDLLELTSDIKRSIEELTRWKHYPPKQDHQIIDKYIEHFTKEQEHYNAQRTDLQKDSPSYKFLMNTSIDKLARTLDQGYSSAGEFILPANNINHLIENAPKEIIDKIVTVQERIAERNQNQTKFASVKDAVANFCNRLANYVGKGVQDKDFVTLQKSITAESQKIRTPNKQNTLSSDLENVKTKLTVFNQRVAAKSNQVNNAQNNSKTKETKGRKV